ncbi:MmgE/PrpD family protein [Microvirga guangxiensis]|uniref:2-methylcitrate dehydratase PrpD n=1 Tax=Microvirga guangxiensis TaxID=549386 RepID=A0A1G5LAQ0_9HYPH|nr:MmgE/PrpD family protein [Microvirga guangxiensis]SCZ09997.1 2-methylcitrate dehydratase PrpD [Microvirga guangxiensis]
MSIATPQLVPASVLLAEPRPTWLTEWGAFASAFRFSDMPSDLIVQAKVVLLDCIGAVAAGMQEPEMRRLVERLGRRDSGSATAIGAGRRLSPLDAAFANGVAGTMLELDEGNQFARGHPGIHVLPAALAAQPCEQMSGADFLRAFVLGYEICARVGAASRLRSTVHPHGTWGTIGAAFVAALLEKANESDLVQIISMAAPLSISASLRSMLEGATVRNSYAGISARNGLAAWDLVASGFSSETDGVRSVYGNVLSETFRPEIMTEELGRRWEIQRNYFKRHAACRFTHGALDAVAEIIAKDGTLDPDSIERIEVDTYAFAAQLDAPAPTNMLAAKFSVPFSVATTLVHGEASVEAFRSPALADERVRRLAQRVSVRENSQMTAMLPDRRPAQVTIHLSDGRVVEGKTLTNRGDAQDPYSPDEVRAKFFALAVPVWGQDHAERIDALIGSLEGAADLSLLDTLLAEPPVKKD